MGSSSRGGARDARALELFLTEMLQSDHESIPRGEALDIATGKGRNAIFLAEQGFDVVGIDISPIALAEAQGAASEKSLAMSGSKRISNRSNCHRLVTIWF